MPKEGLGLSCFTLKLLLCRQKPICCKVTFQNYFYFPAISVESWGRIAPGCLCGVLVLQGGCGAGLSWCPLAQCVRPKPGTLLWCRCPQRSQHPCSPGRSPKSNPEHPCAHSPSERSQQRFLGCPAACPSIQRGQPHPKGHRGVPRGVGVPIPSPHPAAQNCVTQAVPGEVEVGFLEKFLPGNAAQGRGGVPMPGVK